MPGGIIIMGLNGCGKSTLCRELADLLGYKRMDLLAFIHNHYLNIQKQS